jgi:hypothetical protein
MGADRSLYVQSHSTSNAVAYSRETYRDKSGLAKIDQTAHRGPWGVKDTGEKGKLVAFRS